MNALIVKSTEERIQAKTSGYRRIKCHEQKSTSRQSTLNELLNRDDSHVNEILLLHYREDRSFTN